MAESGGLTFEILMPSPDKPRWPYATALAAAESFCDDGEVIPATCERDVFELWGVPYLEPEERNP